MTARHFSALVLAAAFLAAGAPSSAQVASPLPPPNTGAGATGPGALPSFVPGTNHIAGSKGKSKKNKPKPKATPSANAGQPKPSPRP